MTDMQLSDGANRQLSVSVDRPMTLEEAGERHNSLVKFVTELMREGTDYGKMPGSDKPTLLKPGAEKLSTFFRLRPRFVELDRIEDWTGEHHGGEPFFYYKVICRLYRLGSKELVSEYIASINSWEAKYRYRKAERICPECHQATIFKSKDKPEFYCWRKKGGCGAIFGENDTRITSQEQGLKPNNDIFSLVNTLVKMVEKRAFVAAVSLAVNASEFFSQDLEEIAVEGNWTEAQGSERKTPEQERAKSRAVSEMASRAPRAYTPEQIGRDFDDPPPLDEHGEPIPAAPVKLPITSRTDVDLETGEVLPAKKAAPVEDKKPQAKPGEKVISPEYVRGALTYRKEGEVEMVQLPVEWGSQTGWKPAQEVARLMPDAVMEMFLDFFIDPKSGKRNTFSATGHLSKHFNKVRFWRSLTWAQAVACWTLKKYGIPDKDFYPEEFAKWSAEQGNPAQKQAQAGHPQEGLQTQAAPIQASGSTQVTPLRQFYGIPETGLPAEEVQAFIDNMAKLPDPYVLKVLMDRGLSAANPAHFEQFVTLSQALADQILSTPEEFNEAVEVTVESLKQPA